MSDDVEAQLQGCLAMAEALLDVMDSAVRTANPNDVWRFAGYQVYMQNYNELAQMANTIERIQAPLSLFDMDKVPRNTSTIAMQQQEMSEAARANLQILRAYLTSRVNPKEKRISGVADFLQSNLRKAILRRPEREHDVQDAIEQLFIGVVSRRGSTMTARLGE